MPKNPAASPVTAPAGASFRVSARVRWTPASPSALRGNNIDPPTSAMASANQISRWLPSTCLAKCAPISDPVRPAPPNTSAHGHLTRPARA
jgi:hypothetical protein